MKTHFLIAVTVLASFGSTLARSAAQLPPKPQSETIRDPKLAKELIERTDRDQKARFAFIDVLKKNPDKDDPKAKAALEAVRAIDKVNLAWLKKLVQKHGWPTISQVGSEAAHDAWLLAQHSDKDPKFQRDVLDRMKPLVASKEALGVDFAYLTDRVLLAEGKKQVYGTQVDNVGKTGYQPKPTEDPDNLDRRRKEVGLMPEAEYIKMVEKMYGGTGH